MLCFSCASAQSENEPPGGRVKSCVVLSALTSLPAATTTTVTTTTGNAIASPDCNSPKVDAKKRNRRSSSLKLPNGVRQSESKGLLRRNEEARIEIIEEQQPLVGPAGKLSSQKGVESLAGSLFAQENIHLEDTYVDDYISPAMNYKDSCTKSPPIIHTHDLAGAWEKDDNISLYGTPKEEAIPGLGDTKGPSFMRSQIEALFQPSGNVASSLILYSHYICLPMLRR